METENSNQVESKRGCLLTGALVWCIFEALVMSIFFVGDFASHFSERTLLQNIVSVLAAAVSLASFYFIVISFKLKKRGLIGLLIFLVIWTVLFIVLGVIPTPESQEAKAGAGWSLISVVANIFFIVLVGINLKRCRS